MKKLKALQFFIGKIQKIEDFKYFRGKIDAKTGRKGLEEK